MKKVIIITTITLSLSSCGLKLGDYHRYQEVYGRDGLNHKVMKDGPKVGYTYKDPTTGETKKGTDGWQANQFTK